MANKATETVKGVNPLAGKESLDIHVTDASTADVRPVGSTGGPEFIMPSQSGTLRPSNVLKVLSLYTPDSGAAVATDQIRHIVGLPVVPMDVGSEPDVDGVRPAPRIKVTGVKGYGAKSSKPSDAVKSMLTKCDPKAGFETLFDKYRDKFKSLWFKGQSYSVTEGPTMAELQEFLDSLAAAVTRVKGRARDGTSLRSMGIEEQTFIIAPTRVAFPARMSAGPDTSPIVFKVAPSSIDLINPDYFGNTQPRLAYTAWWEMCKYFGRGQTAPLELIAMYQAYGPTGEAQNVPQFLESVLSRINSTGKFAYGVKAGSSATGLDKATRYNVAAIMMEVFAELVRYAVFKVIRPSLSMSDLMFDVELEWYNEYNEDYGGGIIISEARNMEYMGAPNPSQGGLKIKAWPYAIHEDGVDAGPTDAFALTPLRLAEAGKKYVAEPNAIRIASSSLGWMREDNKQVSRPFVPAKFDPEVGLIVDTEVQCFLEVVPQGEAYAGWIRKNVYDSMMMYHLGVTRATNHRYNLGMGPMTWLDSIVGRECAFDGNVVPFRIAPVAGLQKCVPGTFILNPELILKDPESDEVSEVKPTS